MGNGLRADRDWEIEIFDQASARLAKAFTS